MTNYIKKLIAAVTLAGSVFVTPVMAQECSLTFSDYKTKVETMKAEGEVSLEIITVTPSQLKNFTDASGDPPNTDMSKPYEAFLVKAPSGLAMLMIVQNDCVTVTAGPAPFEVFLKKFGLVDASLVIEYNASLA